MAQWKKSPGAFSRREHLSAVNGQQVTQRRGALQGDVVQSGSHIRLATGLGAEPCPPENTWASDLHDVPHLVLVPGERVNNQSLSIFFRLLTFLKPLSGPS